MSSIALPVVCSCRDFGDAVTNDLSPAQHISEITAKTYQRANAIMRCLITRNTKNVLVQALFMYVPYFNIHCVSKKSM